MLNKKVIALTILSVYTCNLFSPNLIYAKTIKLDEMEITIPNNLPSFNESISKKYESALNSLKEEGFESNIKTEIDNSNSSSSTNNIGNLFLEKFPNHTNSLTNDIVDKQMEEVQESFTNKYENFIKEELPSKDATLIWDKEEILNSASKPQGYDEALKKTTAKLEGGVSEDFKNKVEGNINSIFSYLDVHQNDKPTMPNAPDAGKAPTPEMLYAEKPDYPEIPEGIKPDMPTLKKPSADKITLPFIFNNLLPNLPISVPSQQPSTQPSTVPSTQTSIVPSTTPSTQTSTSPSTQPTTSPSSKPVTKPNTSPSTKPVTKPTVKPSPNAGVVPPSNKPQKDETKNNGNSWGDSILKGGLATLGTFVVIKGVKIAIGAITGSVPGALAGALL